MTIPTERTRSVLSAREFLYALIDPQKTPRVPRPIRQHALRVLRHYPFVTDLQTSARECPSVWGKPDTEQYK
jgi:hypothetical protein